MNIFVLLALALALILIMLRLKISIGPCMLAAGLFLWLERSARIDDLLTALTTMLTMPRTVDAGVFGIVAFAGRRSIFGSDC